ncbi:glycosyltransferase [Peribacillus asahii]|uniref:glycosyltransferase family 2 protein n=1 Tax=Peribacillus asahii TaxID=228899 RepID=UPI00380DDF7A
MADVFLYISVFLIWLMLFYHAFLMSGGYFHFLKYRKFNKVLETPLEDYPTVSILIPAHNEEVVIRDTIEAMIALTYPKDKLEVIVINDNSSDDTGPIIERYAREYSFVQAVSTKPPNAGKGKSSALNQGLKASSGDIIIVYDADNTPEPDAVTYLALGLLQDKKAGAMVGKFRVINAQKNLLTGLINIETLTFQWLAQAGRWFWFKMTTIPGTNFAIRRSVLEELAGWDEKALSEDTELSIRVYNMGYYIRFFPSAITWEQEPETLRVWWKQRTRWARGNQYVILKYLFKLHQLKNKKVILDIFYFLFTYFFFFAGALLSQGIFVVNLMTDLELSMGDVSGVLLIIGFLLFVTEICLALSMEKNQLTWKNFFIILLMYFTYSQMWIFLVVYSSYLEIKRVLFKQDVRWYKTQRFKQAGKEEKPSA